MTPLQVLSGALQGGGHSKAEEAAGRRLAGQLAERLEASLSTSSLPPMFAVTSLLSFAGLHTCFTPPAPLIAALSVVLQCADMQALFTYLSPFTRAELLVACCALQVPETARAMFPYADHHTAYFILDVLFKEENQQVIGTVRLIGACDQRLFAPLPAVIL